ncbi:MAG: cobyrinic acid a,c-diamide synthase [Geobacteraceae bacterium GWC2_58_44]|nr:MAG: cobyrinic acid a,c-diamide synthase [Geobacteraceae bacterium GWC2_58_44]HBG04953.1 cobyrinic acid a,c-diamide synthase [Geobacter sp.]
MKRIVIAAPHSGSGKTTLTLGIMAALKSRGLSVAPFKVGPDFIDPGYHRVVTGTPSVNLDGWICAPGFVRASFAHHAAGADIAVIEGVMGLFDGIDGVSEAGSTAEIAKLLGAPVILVVDARSQARSAAALVHGFASFDPGVRLAGVIFNNVASPNHERVLREALAAGCPKVALLGCVPRDAALAIPSRHLGLLTAEENPLSEGFVEHLARVIDRHLDLAAILDLDESEQVHQVHQVHKVHKVHKVHSVHEPKAEPTVPVPDSAAPPVKIAVARDAAFCFVYQDNLRLLRESGAELCCFSPLQDQALPAGISGVYLPGGYPELFAEKLAGNHRLKEEIRGVVEAGMPVYAECGGFIYLTGGVASDQDVAHPLVGIFPVRTRMLPRRKALGYREVELLAESVIGAKGTIARGHEFHYSEMEEMPAGIERLYAVSRKGVALEPEGYRYKNCLASYIHLHFGSSPAMADSFVGHCRAYRKGSLT